MTEPNKSGNLSESMIDALLETAYRTDAEQREARIGRAMKQIGGPVSLPIDSATPISPTRRRWTKWMSWGVAASILLALIFTVQSVDPGRQAMSAVQRSIDVAREYVVRHYRMTVKISSGTEVASDLYVEGNDRFALRHPALLPGSNLWLGNDRGTAWVVPAFGPIRTGDDTALGRWLSQREPISTPYLHVETLLTRMKRGYRLLNHENETVVTAAGMSFECRHITATLGWSRVQKAPNTIELWADADTGVAVRLIAKWDRPVGALGHQRVELELAGTPEVPNNWFSAEGHSQPGRRTLHFDSTEQE